jgi:protein deglycase
MPGAKRFQECEILREIVTNHASQSQLIGAICASPAVVLADFGLLNGKIATCYPATQFRGDSFDVSPLHL